jgi:hypothetical protein
MLGWTFPGVVFPGALVLAGVRFSRGTTPLLVASAVGCSMRICERQTRTPSMLLKHCFLSLDLNSTLLTPLSGSEPVYRFGPNHFDMKKFFDANIDRFDIFVFHNLNADDHTWKAE